MTESLDPMLAAKMIVQEHVSEQFKNPFSPDSQRTHGKLPFGCFKLGGPLPALADSRGGEWPGLMQRELCTGIKMQLLQQWHASYRNTFFRSPLDALKIRDSMTT